MKLLSVPWMWEGIGGQKRDFSTKVTKLLHSDHGIMLTSPATGTSYVKGSGTSQPHMSNTELMPWETVQSADIEVDHRPDAVDDDQTSVTEKKRDRGGEDKDKKKKAKKDGPGPSSSEDPDGIGD